MLKPNAGSRKDPFGIYINQDTKNSWKMSDMKTSVRNSSVARPSSTILFSSESRLACRERLIIFAAKKWSTNGKKMKCFSPFFKSKETKIKREFLSWSKKQIYGLIFAHTEEFTYVLVEGAQSFPRSWRKFSREKYPQILIRYIQLYGRVNLPPWSRVS